MISAGYKPVLATDVLVLDDSRSIRRAEHRRTETIAQADPVSYDYGKPTRLLFSIKSVF